MSITFAGSTHVGRVRARNEDALLQRPARRLIAVADGMGGHAAGDIASRIAIDVLDDRTAARTEDAALCLRDAAEAAHQAILRASGADPALAGMGTTLTALWLRPEGAAIGHVGDSRAYRLRGAALERLTRDQTWVQDRVDAGVLSEAQARDHPYAAMLTSALGGPGEVPTIQIVRPDMAPGDLFLLCSDGLTAGLDDAELRRILVDHPDLDAAAAALVDAANDAGGPDNITVALARVSAQ